MRWASSGNPGCRAIPSGYWTATAGKPAKSGCASTVAWAARRYRASRWVVMDPQRRLLVDVFPCEDGHAQERSLLKAVLPTVQAGELWIADRNFCTVGFLRGIHERGAYGLLRLHGGLPFTQLTPWGDGVETAEGQRVREQAIEVEGLRYRRIRVELTEPTRDGDRLIDLITDLPETVSAVTLAALYRKRWTLATAFQHLEKHFESEINTLAYPRAALFGFCLALVAYNIFQITLTALDGAHPEPVSQTISTYFVGPGNRGDVPGLADADRG